jgi:hypothetical protein
MHRRMRMMQVAAISAVVACLAPVARAEPVAVGAQYGGYIADIHAPAK